MEEEDIPATCETPHERNIVSSAKEMRRANRKLEGCTSEIYKKLKADYDKMKYSKKSKRWGNRTISESSVSHLEYDFSRGWPPVLISPVQKGEMESLESQLKVMSVETKVEKQKKTLEKIRKYRFELNEDGRTFKDLNVG